MKAYLKLLSVPGNPSEIGASIYTTHHAGPVVDFGVASKHYILRGPTFAHLVKKHLILLIYLLQELFIPQRDLLSLVIQVYRSNLLINGLITILGETLKLVWVPSICLESTDIILYPICHMCEISPYHFKVKLIRSLVLP